MPAAAPEADDNRTRRSLNVQVGGSLRRYDLELDPAPYESDDDREELEPDERVPVAPTRLFVSIPDPSPRPAAGDPAAAQAWADERREAERAALAAVLAALGQEIEVRWHQRAGCGTCHCSPGWLLSRPLVVDGAEFPWGWVTQMP
jgi:hypothetical protein